MHMKHFQGIADIRNHYDDIFRQCQKESTYGWMLLETWGIKPEDIEDIKEEHEVLRYLLGCRLTIVSESSALKPTHEVVERLFKRHLAFLESIHDCHAFNVNKHRNPLIRKQYKTCTHYLFKFSLQAWVEKLPAVIPTFDEKYPNFRRQLTQ